ncbi:MAG: hypothetical protein IIY77_09790 [Lachnospiraceae bacterium]|nr:hypothetical protein [Lachnospiraceae bacterium]
MLSRGFFYEAMSHAAAYRLQAGSIPAKVHSQIDAKELDPEIQLQVFFKNIGIILPSSGFCRDSAGRSERKPTSETENADSGKIKRTMERSREGYHESRKKEYR